MNLDALSRVPPRSEDGDVHVLVETPTGSRDKFDLNHEFGLFEWSLQLPAGLSFPFSFGFVPNTLAEDGDALDIVLLVDGSFPQGTLVKSRLIGVLVASQDEDGDGEAETQNDRILAVPTLAQTYAKVDDIGDLRDSFHDELSMFFRSYNELIGRGLDVGHPLGRDAAYERLDRAIERHRNER